MEQNTQPRNKPTLTQMINLCQSKQQYSGEKMTSSINSVWKTEQLSAKQAGLCSHSIYKNKLKMD